MSENVRETDSQCPKCKKQYLSEWGKVFMEDGKIRVDYDAECGNCGYRTTYMDVIYSW